MINSNKILHNLMKDGAPEKYLYFNNRYYGDESEFRAKVDMADKPCLLI